MNFVESNNPAILITIDVEDWFQVENFRPWIPFSSWSHRELRVEKNTLCLLDLFDTFSAQKFEDKGFSEKLGVTFFVLGWIAKHLPNLIREIHERGYEVASHGFNHDLCNRLSFKYLKEDLNSSKKRLEDIIGSEVYGYRAPNFSIDNDILKLIEDCGYLYDSSYNSFALHGRYGKADLSRAPMNGMAIKLSHNFYELPISNLKIKNKYLEFPWGGGAYFRIVPYLIFRKGVQAILNNNDTYLFYLHPWEIDTGQPHFNKASRFNKLRHYFNLKTTYDKLKKLLTDFEGCQFLSCSQYLEKKKKEFGS
jgi:polysaccharide deacetylase family protein (PEP-CTERM system associated)